MALKKIEYLNFQLLKKIIWRFHLEKILPKEKDQCLTPNKLNGKIS
jgi:hypothetical protein